jgi:hypothetical protein
MVHLTIAEQINLKEHVIAAIAKLAPDAVFPVGGKLVASKDLQAQIQANVDRQKELVETRAKARQLLVLVESERVESTKVLTAVRQYAAGAFGEASAEFASFGFKERKAPQQKPASRVEAAAKMRATRLARHTMGRRQRAAIHGVVPPSPATPVANGTPQGNPNPTTSGGSR